MKIYLDYIFIENLVINYILFSEISVLTKITSKKMNMIIAIIFLSIYTVLSYCFIESFLSNILIKILTIIIGVYLAYKPKTVILYTKLVIFYLLLSFLYVGIIISVTIFFKVSLENTYIKILLYIIGGIVLKCFDKNMWKMWKTNIKNNDLTYTIKIRGQEIKAFVDTGNSVKDTLRRYPVIFIEEKYFTILNHKNVLEKLVDVDFKTISGKKRSTGYLIDNVEIDKNGKKIANINHIIISFVTTKLDINDNYHALIGYETYIENLRGVTL